jgi:hypothetical protein
MIERALSLAATLSLLLASHALAQADLALQPDAEVYPRVVTRPPFALYVGVEAGSVMPVGLTFLFTLPRGDKLRTDLDLTWEPSNYLQSYSFGMNYHFFDSAFVAGGRLRYLQMHAPWSRGFEPRTDHQLALGPELGARWLIDGSRRFMLFFLLGASFFPGQTLSLPVMYTINLGIALGIAR